MNIDQLPYHQLINQAALPMAIYQDGNFIYINEILEKKIGLSKDEVIGKSVLDFIHDDDVNHVEFILSTVYTSDNSDNKITYRANDKSGDVKWLQSNYSIITVNNKPAVLDIITNFTEQKEIENILLEEERSYRHVFNAIDDLLFIINSDWQIIQCNDSVFHKLGYRQSDINTVNFIDIVDIEYKESTINFIQDLPVSSNEILQSVITTTKGNKIPVNIHVSDGVWSDKKVIYIRCIDISTKLKWENEISAQRNKFLKAFNSNPNAMSLNRIDEGVFIDVNKAFLKITGLTREEILGKTGSEIGIITKQEQLRLFKLYNTSTPSSVTQITLTTKSGETKDIVLYSEELIIEDIPHLLIVMVDKSDIRKAEKDVMDSRAKQNAIIDNIPQEAWLKDKNGIYISVNRPFANFLKLGIKDIIGKSDYDLFPEKEADSYVKEDNEVIITRKQKRILGYKRKEKKWFETFKTPILSVDNNIIGTTGISNDITHSVNFEISLKQNLKRQERLTEISSMLNSLSDFDEKINFVLNIISDELEIKSICIYEDVKTNPFVKYQFSNNIDNKQEGFVLKNSSQLLMQLSQQKLYCFDNAIQADLLADKESEGGNIILFPIFIDNIIYAIIEIVKSKERCEEDAPQVEFIKTVGNIIATTYKRFIAEEKIKRSEHRFREFAEMLPEMVYETNYNGDITFSNNFSFENLKYPIDKQISIFDLFIDSEVNSVKILFDRILKGEKISGKEFTAVRNDGTTIPVLVYSNLITTNAVPTGVRWIMIDITEQKNNQVELTKAKDDAEAASLIKQQFLSTMSHEIRTPLNAVLAISHLLLQEEPKESQVENLNVLRSSAKNLLILINDILDFNKIETGNITLNPVVFSPERLFKQIHNSFEILAREKGIGLNLSIDDKLPRLLLGDKTRLLQILTNLIGNGIKFTPKGGVTLKVIVQEIIGTKANIQFRIEDTGIGIQKEKLDHIFQYFTQETSDTTRQYGGTGLGLAITKKIVEMHNSKIMIETTTGVGSTFFFNLLYDIKESNDNKELDKKDTRAAEIEMQFASDKKILVVEDNEINRLILSKFLNKWNISFDYAINGADALEKVKANFYNLILMDLEMPIMSGYQATEAIRKMNDEKKSNTPIVAITASALLDVQEKIFAIGINDYLLKPFNPKKLSDIITAYI